MFYYSCLKQAESLVSQCLKVHSYLKVGESQMSKCKSVPCKGKACYKDTKAQWDREALSLQLTQK